MHWLQLFVLIRWSIEAYRNGCLRHECSDSMLRRYFFISYICLGFVVALFKYRVSKSFIELKNEQKETEIWVSYELKIYKVDWYIFVLDSMPELTPSRARPVLADPFELDLLWSAETELKVLIDRLCLKCSFQGFQSLITIRQQLCWPFEFTVDFSSSYIDVNCFDCLI